MGRLLVALLFLGALGHAGGAAAFDVEAGPIWNNDDARGKCPEVCGGVRWDGRWAAGPDGTTECGTSAGVPVPVEGSAAGRGADPVCRAALSGVRWAGAWTTVRPGMSVCGCVPAPPRTARSPEPAVREDAGGDVPAGTPEETCRGIETRRWKASPWHLVDMWYSAGESMPFRSLEMEVDIGGAFTDAGPGAMTYVAPLFGTVGRTNFYLGMQTDVSRPGKAAVRGFLFSRWGRADEGDARPAPGGWQQALPHERSNEGDFVGVRLAYPWTAGRYTFRLEPQERDGEGIWVAFEIADHQSGQWIDGGSLRFPASDGTLGRDFASFVEIYGGGIIDNICRTAMPATGSVRFGPLMMNDGALDATRSRCAFPGDVPPLAAVTRSPDGVHVVFGHWMAGERCGGR